MILYKYSINTTIVKGGDKMLKVNRDKLVLAIANSCLTINELEEKSTVARTTISKLTTGKNNKTQAHVLGKIARALGVKVEDLVCN